MINSKFPELFISGRVIFDVLLAVSIAAKIGEPHIEVVVCKQISKSWVLVYKESVRSIQESVLENDRFWMVRAIFGTKSEKSEEVPIRGGRSVVFAGKPVSDSHFAGVPVSVRMNSRISYINKGKEKEKDKD